MLLRRASFINFWILELRFEFSDDFFIWNPKGKKYQKRCEAKFESFSGIRTQNFQGTKLLFQINQISFQKHFKNYFNFKYKSWNSLKFINFQISGAQRRWLRYQGKKLFRDDFRLWIGDPNEWLWVFWFEFPRI